MSDTESVFPVNTFVARICKGPIVRVVEKQTRSLPLKKITASDRVLHAEDAVFEDDIADNDPLGLLGEVVDEVAYKLVGKAAEKILEDEIASGNQIDDTTAAPSDPEVEKLLEAVIDEDGELVKDNDSVSNIFEEPFVAEIEGSYIKKANEENMKDEPLTGGKPLIGAGEYNGGYQCDPRKPNNPIANREVGKAVIGAVREANKQAANGTLDFLKSVEGRVLTVLEAALPDKEHRDAVKTLIKKEFRREMNRVNRQSDEEE